MTDHGTIDTLEETDGRSLTVPPIPAGGPDWVRPRQPDLEPLDEPWRLGLLVAGAVGIFLLLGPRWMLILGGILLAVFLHELGHYLGARRAGMRVTQFFIGIGPRLWSIRRGETEFGIKAVPVAAFVRVIGMNNLEAVEPEEEPRTYRQASFFDRMVFILAGSAMHFAQALVFLVVLHSVVGAGDPANWQVGRIVAGSPADVAGLEVEDRLVAVDGEPVGDFDSLIDVLSGRSGDQVRVTVERGGAELVLPLDVGDRLVEPTPGGAAEALGLIAGDRILSVDGVAVSSFDDAAALIDDDGQRTLTLEVGRQDEVCRVEGVVSADLADEPTTGYFGVGQTVPRTTVAPHVAVVNGIADLGRTAWRSTHDLVRFFSPASLGAFVERVVTTGPVEESQEPESPAEESVCRSAGETVGSADDDRVVSLLGAAQLGAQLEGPGPLLEFFALLNIFIGVFNLTPLLPFDGGHAAIAVYERLRTRRGSRQRHMVDMTRLLPPTYAVVLVLGVVGLGAIYLDLVAPVT